MDRKSGLTDAYVEVSFGDWSDKTSIAKHTLNPKWNQVFRVEVSDDNMLQELPVQLAVWDKDVVSDDSIGTVVLDLNCLLRKGNGPAKISGWFPIYDTIDGIRGFLHCIVSLQFFGDVNPFKNSAAGVKLLSISNPQHLGYKLQAIQGFVEELITADDPEYGWKNSFRSSQKSNEERQILFYHLARKIRRAVGRKALEMGGNSVLGYHAVFDLEYDTGLIVARGYGTACTLSNVAEKHRTPAPLAPKPDDENEEPSIASSGSHGSQDDDLSEVGVLSLKVQATKSAITFDRAYEVPESTSASHFRIVNPISMLDIHLLTISSLPNDMHFRIGGIVSARSVKLLSQRDSPDQVRDEWRSELRDEIRTHAKTLCCNLVLGYTELTTICEDICILTAYGTAVRYIPRVFESKKLKADALKSLQKEEELANDPIILDDAPVEGIADSDEENVKNGIRKSNEDHHLEQKEFPPNSFKRKRRVRPCSFCHVPYPKQYAPFRMNIELCNLCNRRYVPEILLANIEPPETFPVSCQGQLLQARVFREKKKLQGKANAIAVSEILPFLELEVHRQLLHKLRVIGYNAIFHLRMDLALGEEFVIAVATCTAVYSPALSAPSVLKISRNIEIKDAEDEILFQTQKRLMKISTENNERAQDINKAWMDRLNNSKKTKKRKGGRIKRVGSNMSVPQEDEFVELKSGQSMGENNPDLKQGDSSSSSSSSSETSSSDEEDRVNFALNDKDMVVMQIDDESDEKTMIALLDPQPPPGIIFVNTESLPLKDFKIDCVIDVLSILRRIRINAKLEDPTVNMNDFIAEAFNDALASFCYKIRSSTPCCVTDMQVLFNAAQDDDIDLVITGTAVKLHQPEEESPNFYFPGVTPLLIPPIVRSATNSVSNLPLQKDPIPEFSQSDSLVNRDPLSIIRHVTVTSLSYIPGRRVRRYLGRVHLSVVREFMLGRVIEQGASTDFSQQFLGEALTLARAHVSSRGGNALLGYRVSKYSFQEIKNTGFYGVIGICGEAAELI
jgi:uncharacterized protein YbjQ (UPF0145 family)